MYSSLSSFIGHKQHLITEDHTILIGDWSLGMQVFVWAQVEKCQLEFLSHAQTFHRKCQLFSWVKMLENGNIFAKIPADNFIQQWPVLIGQF